MDEFLTWLNDLPKQQRRKECKIALRNMAKIEAFAKGAFGPEVFAAIRHQLNR